MPVSGPICAIPSVKMLGNMMELNKPTSSSDHMARWPEVNMEAATKNAGEVIEALTLHMNKVRQAAITTEIIEIVSGANYGK